MSTLVEKAAALAPSAIKGNLDDAGELPLGKYLEQESRRFLKNMILLIRGTRYTRSSKSDHLDLPELTAERVSSFAGTGRTKRHMTVPNGPTS